MLPGTESRNGTGEGYHYSTAAEGLKKKKKEADLLREGMERVLREKTGEN